MPILQKRYLANKKKYIEKIIKLKKKNTPKQIPFIKKKKQ
jgi:hypothetical protein